jgi:hypothetical protein
MMIWLISNLAESLLLLDADAASHHLRQWAALNTARRILQGQPLSASQSHIGQVLDEYLLSRDLLNELQLIRTAPVIEQIEAVTDLIRREPDHMAPAVRAGLSMWAGAGVLIESSLLCEPGGAALAAFCRMKACQPLDRI